MRSILYHLMKNPDAYSKLMLELDTAVARGEVSEPVKYSEAIRLPFLCASIKEAMRLHPSVGLTMPRMVPKGGMVLDGKFIPEGYRIGMNAAVVHYNETVFGIDANKFRPQRWLAEGGPTMDKYMMHFGAGTRTCIGKNVCRLPISILNTNHSSRSL